ncbi:MAG: hypothetical protein ACE141_11845 [Bryobacteraceae bacterium]
MKPLLRDGRLVRLAAAALLAQLLAAVGGLLGTLATLGEQAGALSDTGLYYRYASEVLSGAWPYRDFRIEYPPLALPFFLLPRLFTADRLLYALIFGFLMFLLHGATVVLVAGAVRSSVGAEATMRRLVWYTVCFCLLCPLPVARYDVLPALLCTASVLAWRDGWGVKGSVLAGIGALVKVFPAVVEALGVLGELQQRRRMLLRSAGAFTATLAAGILFWLALGGQEGVMGSVRFQTGRGLEVGSLYAGAFLLASKTGVTETSLTYNGSAWHVGSAWSGWIGDATVLMQVAALAMVCRRYWTTGGAGFVRWAAAAVVAVVVTSKVLSPQFLLWILPLVALIEGKPGDAARKVFLLCCGVTTLVFPWLFTGLVRREFLPIVLLNLRNALLLGLLLLLLVYPRLAPSATSASRRGSA